MRIAQIAPLHEAVPPKFYGGTERVVSYLTEALVELGHEVTLFASGDSKTSAKLDAVWPQSLRLDPTITDTVAPHMLLLEQVRRRAHEFDILHFHIDYYPFSLFSQQTVPNVTTMHGRLDTPELQPIFNTFNTVPVISISNNQRTFLPQANWLTTVLHGLPKQLLIPNKKIQPSYLAFLGRISPEKRVDRAIKIAAKAKMPIKIAAKLDNADLVYYEQKIKPLLCYAHVEFVGEINDTQKAAFLSGAHALLFPIDWPEPFGLVMIESMACGTPVIAYNNGSVPEIIKNNISGFIVEDENSAVDAVKQITTLQRSIIRKYFEEHFTSLRMAQEYVVAYKKLL